VKTADYIFKLLEQQGALGEHQLGKTITISYLFPFTRREKLEQTTWRLLEILKHLPKDLQLEMALNMIQFIYKLDSGLDLSVEEAEARLRAQLKSG
jgi:hypothetical protein